MADLKERIESEFEAVRNTLAAKPSTDRLAMLSVLELAGTASLVHNFYNGIENVLKQVFVAQGLSLPDGPAWHRDLLSASSDQGIISLTTADTLKQYLAFRHFFSHAYALDLDPQRLEPLIHDAASTFAVFLQDIESRL